MAKVKAKRDNVTMVSTPDVDQSNVWDFPVHQEELFTKAGYPTGIHAVVRGDNQATIGQYKGEILLPYAKLVEAFDGALTKAGFKFQRSFLTTGNGARFFGRYDLGNGLHANGEGFSQILRLQSSHDGTLTPGFTFEAERLSCLNGMMGLAELFAFFQRHGKNFDLGFITGNIIQAINDGAMHAKQTVELMAGIAVNDETARNILSNIVKLSRGAVSEKSGYIIYNNWRNPVEDEKPLGDTLYRLYNATTRYCRDISKVGRFELSRRGNIYVTGAFDLAVRKPHNLNALTFKPDALLDFDGITVNL